MRYPHLVQELQAINHQLTELLDMATQRNLELIAKWVNTHDDGTPQPRAVVEGDRVAISSTEWKDGYSYIEKNYAISFKEAREILGY